MKVRDIAKSRKQGWTHFYQWRKAKIEEINKSYQRTIAKFGYMIQGVASNPSYMYTIGFSQQHRPEFIVFGNHHYQFMLEVIRRFKERDPNNFLHGAKSEIFETDLLLVPMNGENVNTRVMVAQVDLKKAYKYAIGIWNQRLQTEAPCAIYQLFLGDLNNLLPGEEGYVPYANIPDLRPDKEEIVNEDR